MDMACEAKDLKTTVALIQEGKSIAPKLIGEKVAQQALVWWLGVARKTFGKDLDRHFTRF